MSGVLVIAEHRQGALREATLECLGAALALGGEVTTLLLADAPDSLAGELTGRTHGLKLYAHPDLAAFNPELYLPVVIDAVQALQPSLVLMPHSSQGMDLAPALAGRMGLPLVTDCTGMSWNDGALAVQRAVYGGKAMQELTLKPAATVVATLQAGAYQAAPAGAAETAAESITLTELAPRHARRFLEYLAGVVEEADLVNSRKLSHLTLIGLHDAARRRGD
ncbi:MAG: hypothetical protein KKH66_07625, partial [Proteobacteria bacterium]|nr:hypothetical protein [Pseudomonadota bacterium]